MLANFLLVNLADFLAIFSKLNPLTLHFFLQTANVVKSYPLDPRLCLLSILVQTCPDLYEGVVCHLLQNFFE